MSETLNVEAIDELQGKVQAGFEARRELREMNATELVHAVTDGDKAERALNGLLAEHDITTWGGGHQGGPYYAIYVTSNVRVCTWRGTSNGTDREADTCGVQILVFGDDVHTPSPWSNFTVQGHDELRALAHAVEMVNAVVRNGGRQ